MPASDEDVIADIIEQHNQFLSSMQSRSAKLQVISTEAVLSYFGNVMGFMDWQKWENFLGQRT